MTKTLNAAVNLQMDSLHQDITLQHEGINKNRQKKVDRSFKETETEKFRRLSREFDDICDKQNAEKYLQNLIVDYPNDAELWTEYAHFALRYGMFIRAEHFFKKVIEINGIDSKMKVKMGALLLSRGNYREAKIYFD